MTVTDFNVRNRRIPADAKPLSLALLLAVLGALAVACLVMIVPPIWNVMNGASEQRQARLFQCAIVDNERDRLACYDRIGSETLQPPAKGANAPLGLGVKDIFAR